MELITEKPFWYIIFCLLAGTGYALVLYYKEKTFSETTPWIIRTMAVFRFVAVSLISFLLLSPLVNIIRKETEKPIIIIAQDDSESILLNKDSAFLKNEYVTALKNLQNELGEKYEVKSFSFGEKISENLKFSYKEKQTNISDLIDEAYTRYNGRNVGAIILASDGLYNQGSDPLFAAEKLKVPFYTIALGDTNVRKDVILKKVNHNKTAFLGNSFPLEIGISAFQCKGQNVELTVAKDSSIVFSKKITFGASSSNINVPLSLEASKKGIQHYKIKVSTLDGEVSNNNNIKDIYIEVIESKQKILLLANAPHPDLGALKLSIENNQNYEVITMLADKFDGNISKYNLVILHQLPSQNNPVVQVLNSLQSEKQSVWYVVGSQTFIPSFNKSNNIVTINDNGGRTNDILPTLAANFSLFTLSDELKKNLSELPPVSGPFGTYKLSTNGYILLKQQIGSVKTEQPLLVFSDNGDSKIAVFCGEGLWKWKMRTFANNNNHSSFDELIVKTVQYLAVKETKDHFIVKSKNNYPENEPIMLDAEVYNDSYELVNTSDATLIITGKNKQNYTFTFSKTNKAYTLNAGYLPVGTYTYKATTKVGEKVYTKTGIFSITPLQVEFSETIADHHLLYRLSQKTGGQMVFPDSLSKIADMLNLKEDIRPISYSHNKLEDFINLKWVFFLILAFITSEWFFRKQNGGY